MPWVLLAILALILLAAGWLLWTKRANGQAWLPDVGVLAVLALAVLGFFWRVASGQNWMPADGGDLASFLFPTYRFAAGMLRAGAWPLWNPALYAGAPHAADIQAGFLYPPNLLLFLTWPDFPYRALQWLSMAHIWFAGAGTYLFLARGVKLPRLAALAGALAFMFSDALLVHFGNLNFNAVASWLPWVFWAYLAGLEGAQLADGPEDGRDVEKPSFGRAALAGALLAVATLAGHIQATLFILLALGIYTVAWLYLWRDRPGPGRRALQAVLYGGLTTAITALLAAPVLLPALQLTAFTSRANWNYQEAAGYSVSPAQWIGLVIPGFFGRGPQLHWGAWPRVEVGYLGILPLILAGLAVALRRDRRTWGWIALAGACFIVALGTYAEPHGWLTLVPGFGQLRAPARLVFVADFGLAVAAALGLAASLGPLSPRGTERFDRATRWVSYATVTVWAIGVPLAYATLLLTQDRDQSMALRISVTLIAVLLFGGILAACAAWLWARRGAWAAPRTLGLLAVALIFLDLGATGAYQDLGNQDPSQSFSQPAIAGFLQAQPGPFRIDSRTDIEDKWQPDTALLYRLEDVTGLANPLGLADVERYWAGLGSRSSALYDLLNVRYIIAHKDVVLDWQKFKLVFDGSPDLNVYVNQRALPRAMIVPKGQPAASHEAAWQAIHEPQFDPAATAVVEGQGGATGGGRGTIGQIEETPNGVALEATVDGQALLLLSQVWYPGWRAWIDGRPYGEPLRADYLFQALPLEAGTHRVELRFEPPLWTAGWIVAAVTLIGLLVWAGVGIRRRAGVVELAGVTGRGERGQARINADY